MYNAAIKSLVGASILSIIFTSCGGNPREKAAQELYTQAESLVAEGNPSEAIVLLDSIASGYQEQVEWQRRAMALRPQAIIAETDGRIAAVSDSLSLLEGEFNAIKAKMKQINDARLVEPFSVDAATYRADFMSGTGIQPRVSEIGQFYVISSVNPGGPAHTHFTLTATDGQSVASGTVPYDGEMNYRISGSEVVTYSPEQSEAVGAFATAHRGQGATVTFTGKNSRAIKLSAREMDAIANCYEYSRAIVLARQLAFERERLTRQREIATSQLQRLTTPVEEK